MLIFSYLHRFNPSSHKNHIVGPSQEPRTGTALKNSATKTNDENWMRANPHVIFDEGEGNSAQGRYAALRHRRETQTHLLAVTFDLPLSPACSTSQFATPIHFKPATME